MNNFNNFIKYHEVYKEKEIELEKIKSKLVHICTNLDYNEVVKIVSRLNYNDALTIFVLLREYGANPDLLKKVFEITYLKKSAMGI
ncbi:hypothetical protein QJL41_12190 [Clostridioides difficile]|nr:hypothetical protein [Clostridioides difficile]MDK3168255.1 hypothetical protein [Clostridioides difficile]